MTFGEKLKIARTNSGLKQAELAKQLNTTGNTISNWENNVSKPDLDTLSYICGILNVKASYFLEPKVPEDEVTLPEFNFLKKYRQLDAHGQGTISLLLDRELSRVTSMNEQLHAKNQRISTLEAALNQSGTALRIYTYMRKIAAAGTGFYFDDIPTDTIEAPYCEKADFIIGVSGDSMEPTFHDGDLVYVEKCQGINIGEIGIFTLNNECYIKEAGENALHSHNPNYNDIPGTDQIICVGRVLGKVGL